MNRVRNVAVFFDSPPTTAKTRSRFLALGRWFAKKANPAPVYGARVASYLLSTSIVRYAHVETCTAIQGKAISNADRSRLAQLPAEGWAKQVNAITHASLPQSLRRREIDILVDPNPTFHYLSGLRRRAADRAIPIITVLHSISYAHLVYSVFLPTLLADSYPCDSIVCTSRAVREAFLKVMQSCREQMCLRYGVDARYRGRTDIIPLGVDTNLFCPRDKQAMRYALGLPRKATILLCLGRMSAYEKGDLLPLLRVFKDLLVRFPRKDLFLLIVGTAAPGYSPVVAEAIRLLGIGDRTRLILGYQTDPAFWYSAADIFVCPADSVQESFGLTPLEAMASGVPQVLPDWNGYRNTVRHGETGFLIPTFWDHCDGAANDAAGVNPVHCPPEFDHLLLSQSVVIDMARFRESLQCLIANPELRAEFARNSRRRAVEMYSWQKIVEQYQSLWTDLYDEAGKIAFEKHNDDFAYPSYSQWFGHYATQLVSANTLITLAGSGTEIKQGRKPIVPPTHPAATNAILREEVLRAVLVSCEETDITLGRIVDALSGMASREDVRRHVLWLAKQGYLQLESSGAPDIEH